MKVDHNQKRLDAIKLKYAFQPTECDCCGEEFIKEKMYSVKRWGVNQKIYTCHFCQNCMHSKEEVLHEIDTDTGFGIAFVDSFGHYPEKDYTRIRESIHSLPNPNGVKC